MFSFRFIPLVALLIMTCSCYQSPHQSELKGFISTLGKSWPSKDISVCFEDNSLILDMETVSAAVHKAYAEAGFNFNGWSICTSTDTLSIKVRFDPNSSISVTAAQGPALAGVSSGIILGMKGDECSVFFSGSHCEENTAIHEFGHALGLHHEMNRRDNSTCEYAQFETDVVAVVQIGDFDEYSIMNYCSLFKNNAENKFQGLSKGDLDAIHTLYDSPAALLTQINTAPILKSDLKLSVGGPNIIKFSFAFGLPDEIDCTNPSVYSKPISAIVNIATEEIDKLPSGRTAKLCLLGQNAQGQWQNSKNYSSYLIGILDPLDKVIPILKSLTLLEDVYDSEFLIVDVKKYDSSEITNMQVEFSYLENNFKPTITSPLIAKSKDNSHISLRLRKRDLPVIGNAFISKLTINDINGNSLVLSAQGTKLDLQPDIISPIYRVREGIGFEDRAPILQSLEFTPSITHNFIHLKIGAVEDSGLSRIRLKITNLSTGLSKILYSYDITKVGPDAFLGNFPILSWSTAESGIWKIKSLDVYDIFGFKGSLTSQDLTKDRFDNSTIIIPTYKHTL